MTAKENLWDLVENFVSGKYKAKDFCSKFSQIYNLEQDYNTLSEKELFLFKYLGNMVDRFSDCEEDLKIPDLFCSEKNILKLAKRIIAQRGVTKE